MRQSIAGTTGTGRRSATRHPPASQRRRRHRGRWAALTLVLAMAIIALSQEPIRTWLGAGLGDAEAEELPTALDGDLQHRFSRAGQAANADDVDLWITSGWRSAEEQQRLFDAAVEQYGSVEEASRWVMEPMVSAHVRGLAIDVGPPEGAQWLAQHGSEFGLCRVYLNEPWHFEPLVEPGGTCPDLLTDASVASG